MCGMIAAIALIAGAGVARRGVGQFGVPNDVHVENGAVVPLTKVLPADPARATVTDGVSFHTLNFRAKNKAAMAHVRVTAYASAAQPNVGVVAVFVGGEPAPRTVVSKPLRGDRSEAIELEVDVRANGTNDMSFEFRVGPGVPGIIVFNGPEGQATRRVTRISITERPSLGSGGS
jgi:hypothetical protein